MPTLRILEEALAAYDSTILVVSHDRYFLNRVCNHILAFDEPGHPVMDVGDFDYYASRKKEKQAPEPKKTFPPPPPPPVKKSAPKKLSYMEGRELEQLESAIPELEDAVAALEAKFSDPSAFTDPVKEMRELTEKITSMKADLESKYARWEELAAKQENLKNS